MRTKSLTVISLEFKHMLERNAYTEGIHRLLQYVEKKQQAGGTPMRKMSLFAEQGRVTGIPGVRDTDVVVEDDGEETKAPGPEDIADGLGKKSNSDDREAFQI